VSASASALGVEDPVAGSRLGRWLGGDHADRVRYVDMQTRFRAPYLFGAAISTSCLLVAVWDGWPF